MCYKVECSNCGKFTWGGCGRHKESVLAQIPADQQCRCDELQDDENQSISLLSFMAQNKPPKVTETEKKQESFMYNLLRAAVVETTKKMMEESKQNVAKKDNDDEKKTNIKYPDYTEKEATFFQNNRGIAALKDMMVTKNEYHPLYDLKSWEHQQWAITLAELILRSKFVKCAETLTEALTRVSEFEYHCYSEMKKRNKTKIDYGLLYFLGFKLARSRLNMLLLKQKDIKSHLTVIVPMYCDQNRMQSTETAKNGEDFIRRKVSQLQWLYKNINDKLMDWDIIFVDDGCPNNSGQEAVKLIQSKAFDDKNCPCTKSLISVEFLEKGLEEIKKFKNDDTLQSTKDSKKGGAVQYGMYKALEQEIEKDKQHFIIYTDSDLSANMGQCGLLLAELTINDIKKERVAVIGDRYQKGIYSNGYIIGNNLSNEIGIHLRSKFLGELLPPFKNLYDTECGFRLFKRECIEKILPKLREYQDMFDMEVLLKTYHVYYEKIDELKEDKEYICSAGVVWLDNAAESGDDGDNLNVDTFTNQYGQQQYNFIKEIVKIHDMNYKNSKLCDAKWIDFVCNLKWKDYFKICQVVFGNNIKYKIDGWNVTVDGLNNIIENEKYPETT